MEKFKVSDQWSVVSGQQKWEVADTVIVCHDECSEESVSFPMRDSSLRYAPFRMIE